MPISIQSGLIILCLSMFLGACGVRGSLEPPAEAKVEQGSAASADSGQGKAAGEAAKPHRPFILDGLIQ